MSGELDPLDRELERIAANASPAERRAIAREIAADLKKANAQRERANLTPDGEAMEPRKRKSLYPGRLADRARPQRMFRKVPGALVARATEAGAEVGFTGSAERILRVHQLGLTDRVSSLPNAPEVAYPERPVLGISDDDRERLFEKVSARVLNAE